MTYQRKETLAEGVTCICGKNGYPLNSISCPVHGRKSAISDKRYTLTHEQRQALEVVAAAFGWDKLSTDEMRLMAWSAFQYYMEKLR